jgi:hypothetical protein
MSATLERAADLVEEIKGYLVAAAIDNATVTLDLLAVPAALAVGPVLAVQPPKLDFTGTMAGSVTDAEWEVFVIAGPYADRLAAWRVIDPIVYALKDPLDLDGAEPATFAHPSLPEYPAYVLSFTESI